MKDLHEKYDKLQSIYGSQNLKSVYGNGKSKNAKFALVFMNPTKRNISSNTNWDDISAPWLTTKQIWNFLTKCSLFDAKLNEKIQGLKPSEWDKNFCKEVYDEVKNQKLWITNLAKCSQDDARPLDDSVFLNYKELLLEELYRVNPETIFLFGNQVASIVLDKKISVSTCRQQKFSLKIKDKNFECFVIHYPVGNGIFNQHKALEDIKQILKEK
ncbi:MAG: uracil-DNA glycosylase family protein [Spirochaetales bacterium]